MELEPHPITIDLTGLPEPVVREVQRIVREAREQQFGPAATAPAGPERRPPLRGRFAHFGWTFPKEEIDEAQREMWANFPRDFPDQPLR